MVNIPLTKNFAIQSDSHNWILCKRSGDRVTHDCFFTKIVGGYQ